MHERVNAGISLLDIKKLQHGTEEDWKNVQMYLYAQVNLWRKKMAQGGF